MKRHIEEPVTTPDTHGGERTTHPAFATISVNRTSGGATLYGSDLQHQHYMTLRITSSELVRNLSSDWNFSEQNGYIEVAMSESQWAQFISSPNTAGTQCTLLRLMGKTVPGLPPPRSRGQQFKEEAQQAAQAALDDLDAALSAIEDAKLSQATRKALASKVSRVRSALLNSMPFVLDQFTEHMEAQVEQAKADVNAHARRLLGDTAYTLPALEAPAQGATPDDHPVKRIMRRR